MTPPLSCGGSDAPKDNLFHFYEAARYKLLSLAQLSVDYLLSLFMLFLVFLVLATFSESFYFCFESSDSGGGCQTTVLRSRTLED